MSFLTNCRELDTKLTVLLDLHGLARNNFLDFIAHLVGCQGGAVGRSLSCAKLTKSLQQNFNPKLMGLHHDNSIVGTLKLVAQYIPLVVGFFCV